MRALPSLLVLSMLLGVLWRLEVEWHGWAGLTWVGYPHWAVPVGAVAFLVWLAFTPAVRHSRRKWGLLGMASMHAGVTVGLAFVLLTGMFARFNPMAPLYMYAFVGWLVFTPAVAWGIGRLLGYPLSYPSLLGSVLLFALWPALASVLLSGIEPAHADAIHTVKTGAAIPFVVVALGLPWALAKPELEPD